MDQDSGDTLETRKTDPCPAPEVSYPVLVATALGPDRLLYEAWIDMDRGILLKVQKPILTKAERQQLDDTIGMAGVVASGKVWFGKMIEEDGRNVIHTNVSQEEAKAYLVWNTDSRPDSSISTVISERIVHACHKYKSMFFQVEL